MNLHQIPQLPSFLQQLRAGSKRKNAVGKSHPIVALFGIRGSASKKRGWMVVRQTKGKTMEVLSIDDMGFSQSVSKHIKLDNAISTAYLKSGRTKVEFEMGIGK